MTLPAVTHTRDGWENILDKDEAILWQGRPDGAVAFKPANIITFLFGLVFAGFALFWMVIAAQAGGGMWMFGLIHFSVGIGLSFGSIFWGAYKRRHTWYTLTDRRAFIATNMPLKGRNLKSYPIDAETILDFSDAPLSTINFSFEMRRGKNRSYRVDIGFERIENGSEVYRLMRDIQKKSVTEAQEEAQ